MAKKTLLAFAAAVALVWAGCSDDNGSPTSPDAIQGHLTVKMTDAPIDTVAAVDVYVTGLTVKPHDGPVVRIANDIGLVDLLTLQGTTKQLVDLGVEAGEYDFVEVELDQDRSKVVLLDTTEAPLQIASEQVKVVGGFAVPPGGDVTVTLDFDAAASLQQKGNGDWLLTPVIVQVSAG